ncbi:MAG: ATP-binding cassette domain-containing protein [Chloroflexi bacterium]|nr:ATP-binding cassette domain-containing protein [Chloroflexota bacterium]MQC25939.1 ATP-binding cassette domain-containing protein [Chloroflexota bacterium]
MLHAENLHKSFDEINAVNGVSFEIQRGEILSLLGPNGAGKTTTISMLSGLLKPTQGQAYIDGHSVLSDAEAVKQTIGVVPQEIALYPTLSARENLAFWGKMYGLRGSYLQERIAAVLEVAGLAERADAKVETYSGGMKRRINIAVGLLHQPKVLYMDEPTVGIDPQSRRRILDTVMELNQSGLTVLYTTHYMEEAEELSNRIGIIDHGQLIALGSQSELTKTVGEFDIVRIGLEPDGLDYAALSAALQKIAGVNQALIEDDELILQAQEANAVLSKIVSTIDKANGRIRSIKIEEPNLEAVFLHLTGRALRD